MYLKTFALRYGAMLLAGSLVILGTFWVRKSFVDLLDRQARTALDAQWSEMKGYLKIERAPGGGYRPNWYVDTNDDDEVRAIAGIRRLYLLADKEGRKLEVSPAYLSLTNDPPSEIKRRVNEATEGDQGVFWFSQRDDKGKLYVIRAGVVYSESGDQPYYAAIGAPAGGEGLAALTWGLVVLVVGAALAGWKFGRFGRHPDPATVLD